MICLGLTTGQESQLVLWSAAMPKIAAKIDFTPDYIAAICYLLEHREERLLIAVERGVMPANIVMEIARAPDGDVRRALAETYRPAHGRACCWRNRHLQICL
jgi:hypothetical protein